MKDLIELPLFAAAPGPGDHAPLAVRYAAWRASPRGAEFFHALERAVLDQAAATQGRIEVNLVWAQLRRARRPRPDSPRGYGANNSFRAPAARDLIERHPELRGRIEVRNGRKGRATA